MSVENAIEVDSLSKTFKTRGHPPVTAEQDLTLSIPAG